MANASNIFKIKVEKFQASTTHSEFRKGRYLEKTQEKTRVNPIIWPVLVTILATFSNKILFYFFVMDVVFSHSHSLYFISQTYKSLFSMLSYSSCFRGRVKSCLCSRMKILLIQTIHLNCPSLGTGPRTKLGYFLLIISI